MNFTDLAKSIGLRLTSVSRWEDLGLPLIRPSGRNCIKLANALNLTRAETDALIEAAGHPKLDEAMVNKAQDLAAASFPLLFGKEYAKDFLFDLNQKMKKWTDADAERYIGILRNVLRGLE